MNKKIFFIITAVIIFYAVNNSIWLSLNKPPSAEDEFVHLVTSLSYYVHLFRPDLKHLIEIYRHSFWPPLYHITGAVFSFLSSPDYRSTVLFTNLFYFSILLIAVFLIGKTLFSIRAGIFSLIFISLCPVIYGFSRIFMLELALTSAVALGIYAAISFGKIHSFKNLMYLFIALLIGALIKWSFFVFLFPFLFSLYFNMSKKSKNKYLLLLFSGLSAVIVIWYTPHIKEFLFKAKVYILRSEGPPTFLNYFREILFYLKAIVFYYCSLPLFIVFLFSFIHIFFFKKFQFKYSFLLVIIFPILFISILKSHNGRHLIPLLVPISIITGYNLDVFWNRRIKYLFIFLIGCSFINFFLISYIHLASRYKLLGYIPRQIEGEGNSFISSCAAPNQEDWMYDEIIKVIGKYNKEKRFNLPVEYALLSKDKVRYADFSIVYFDIVKKLKGSKNVKQFFLPASNPKRSDFLIMIAKNKDWFEKLKNRDRFKFVDKIKLPGVKVAYIYAQKLEILENKFAYIIVNHKGIYFFLKNDLKNKYKVEFVIVEKPSVIVSSILGALDHKKVSSDKIEGQFYWHDFPYKLNIEIIKSNDKFKINAKLLDKKKEIFMVLFPIEKDTERLKYASLKNSIQKPVFPLSIYRNDVFTIFENSESKHNQPGFLIDIPGAICLNGVGSVGLFTQFFKDELDYKKSIERFNSINIISQ